MNLPKAKNEQFKLDLKGKMMRSLFRAFIHVYLNPFSHMNSGDVQETVRTISSDLFPLLLFTQVHHMCSPSS